MTLHRQRQFRRADTATVIDDAHQPKAAVFDVDVDPRGPGVEAVLHQFLDERGRTLDHFAGGDLVDERAGQQLNGHVTGYNLPERPAAASSTVATTLRSASRASAKREPSGG